MNTVINIKNPENNEIVYNVLRNTLGINIIEKDISKTLNEGNVDLYIFDEYNPIEKGSIEKLKTINPDIIILYIYDWTTTFTHNDLITSILPYEKVIKPTMLKHFMISIFEIYKGKQYIKKLTTPKLEPIKVGTLFLDPNTRVLINKSKEIKTLSVKENDLLYILLTNINSMIKKETILNRAWGKADIFASRSMDVYVSNLRKLLKTNGIKIKIRNISKTGLIAETIK